MNGFVHERAILGDLKDPVLIAAFATPTKAGSTAASALNYLAQQWRARPVAEFEAERLYSYARVRPQLVTAEDGTRSLQWPSNTVYLAEPEGADRSFLLLIGVEPSFGWQDLIGRIESFCQRAGVTLAVMLHAAPASVSHRQEQTPVAAVYGSQELQASFGLPATVFHDGPMSFGAVLSLHLNAAGIGTVDLIALEPFYTPGLPDARAAIALVRILDRQFGTTTPLDSLREMADNQREVYDRAVASSEQLTSLAASLDKAAGGPMLLQGEQAPLSLSEVMEEVEHILGSK